MPVVSLHHDLSKRLEIALVPKQPHASHGTVQNVVDLSSRCFTGCPWHDPRAY